MSGKSTYRYGNLACLPIPCYGWQRLCGSTSILQNSYFAIVTRRATQEKQSWPYSSKKTSGNSISTQALYSSGLSSSPK